ncbi:bifunctional GNAT family N-acetyltransferase/(deoxy)nucleoside triphosphate pyrophosphohydrolase [Swingsia samuiensis]|uniref:8-oxo-dGTP diphosphatase n=1 Tax=Swingsia samuiensis TaxID=1293412 RepID=A0A4Y6ULI2_9PROT|nr:bifunctional GNAT family N-acetyltransferase/(deoxy)nucleoside triphosphate pyrophosphohydrolase [Swingsia samuiensis]QDH17508.1 GNAT family N-acetyltransferase [Swingsia samuiensis]
MTPELKAANLVLRPLTHEDTPHVHRLVNDWKVVRTLSSLPFPYPRDLAEKWIRSTQEDSQAGHAYHFAITRENILIGAIGLVLSEDKKTASLGYWISPALWGQGLTTVAAQRIIEWGFRFLKLEKITADAAIDNPASCAVLKKLDFQEVGKSTRRFLSRGQNCEVTLFELNRARFLELNPTPPLPIPEEKPKPVSTSPEVTTTHSLRKPKTLLVVAAALLNLENKILLAQRPEGKPLAGLWEFPGGKVEIHETPEQALIREMQEELNIDLTASCLAPFTFISENVGEFHLLMPLFVVRRWQGTPFPKEGQNLAWVNAADLAKYPMPDPDLPLIPLFQELLG